MIDQQRINIVVAEGLKAATGCEVVKANLAKAPIPAYPYLSFSVLNTVTKKGTYSSDGEKRYIPLSQTWSFTVQGDKDHEAQIAAMKAKDWLEELGRTYLNDEGIVVQSVGPIMNRDTLLSAEYEYRKGFDAVFCVLNVVDGQPEEFIEIAQIREE